MESTGNELCSSWEKKPGARRLDALRLSAPARENIVIAKIKYNSPGYLSG